MLKTETISEMSSGTSSETSSETSLRFSQMSRNNDSRAKTIHCPTPKLHLGEAGKEVDNKVPSAFMWGEGRHVTGVKQNHGEAGEGVDDEVPGAFMWWEGRQVTGEAFQIITSNLIISDKFMTRFRLHI